VLSETSGVLEDLEERGEEILDDVDARSDVGVTAEIRSGRPDEEIDDYAAAIGADLVVLGNQGLGSGAHRGTRERRRTSRSNRGPAGDHGLIGVWYALNVSTVAMKGICPDPMCLRVV